VARRRAAAEAGTPALRVLHEAGVAHTAHPYEHAGGETRFGDEAVRALREAGVDVSPERVLKTLLADVDGRLVVAVVPVATTLDLKALAAAAGGKRAAMADPARAQRSSGYVLGGISPLGQRTRLPTVVDASACRWSWRPVTSCGSPTPSRRPWRAEPHGPLGGWRQDA
jgi:Cys-tRNA(Pro)/Cys-tRNA(Cys) deacylase